MDIVESVNNRILKALDEGVVPWRKSWKVTGQRNAIIKHRYQGINNFILEMEDEKFNTGLWLTYLQAKSLGGYVKEGESGVHIIFRTDKYFTKEEKIDEDGQREIIEVEHYYNRPILKYFTVFNIKQCEIPEGKIEIEKVNEINTIKEAEKLIEGYINKPKIYFGGDEAHYDLKDDSIKLPEKGKFESSEAYYETLFHELNHSTGHPKRLHRFEIKNQGFEEYGKEELVAEFGSAYLCADCGIVREENLDASYIAGWKESIKADKTLVFKCASLAEKSYQYIKGKEV